MRANQNQNKAINSKLLKTLKKFISIGPLIYKTKVVKLGYSRVSLIYFIYLIIF